ncbi:ABC transporter substrate-binding protein, partial [Chloroflexota bacterium]
TPVVEGPKYGGKLVFVWGRGNYGFDDATAPPPKCYPMTLTNETLITGDWAKGLGGTGKASWQFSSIFEPSLETGLIAESWELPDKDTIIYHIRKGIYWQDKPPANGRELTAEDVAFNITRHFEITPTSTVHKRLPGWFVSATATDKWTVVVKGKDSEKARTTDAFMRISDYMRMLSPEVIEQYGDMRDWRNVIGTGPYLLDDFQAAMSWTHKRNPNYWRTDPLHPGNELPYIDTITTLVIVDPSTRLAALRAHKVDIAHKFATVALEDGLTIIETNPEIEYAKISRGDMPMISMRLDTKPFDDIRVRRALHMSIDFEAILNDYYEGQAEYPVFLNEPVAAYQDAYTPLEEMPDSIKETFSYNPEKAKQLLAEAGYPNGFSTEIVCIPEDVDQLSIVKSYWEDIGVDLKLDPRDFATYTSIVVPHNHKMMSFRQQGMGAPKVLNALQPGYQTNDSLVDDPFINEKKGEIFKFENMNDFALQMKLLKEMQLHALEQVYWVQLPASFVFSMWQPWVKDYHGEVSVGYINYFTFAQYLWIDQDLKEEMTGRR